MPDRGSVWWVALACAFGLASAGLFHVDARQLDWQPGLAWTQPWRAWSAAFVHYSELHLVANLAGCIAVAAFGAAGRSAPRCVVAWLLAWPLTHWGLSLQPQLLHFGGLSGVLHAGVGIVVTRLALGERGARRGIGIAVGAGLVAKVLGEAPWAAALRQPEGWDIAVAPLAHATGALAGTAMALALRVWRR